MENNEVMNYEEVMEPEIEAVEAESGRSGIGTGVAMLLGAGLTIATTAIVKLAKNAYAKHKAKKEAEVAADEHDFVEPTDEEIDAVVK